MAVVWEALKPYVHVQSDSRLFPGATIEAKVDANAPSGAWLNVVVGNNGQEWAFGHPTVAPGQTVELPVPYPHDDLVSGTYSVAVELHCDGHLLERHNAGTYTLRSIRFSV